MLRQVYIILNDIIIYQRNYAKGLDDSIFTNVYLNIKKSAFSKFAEETASYDFFKFKLSYIVDKDLSLVFLFVTGLGDDFKNVEPQLHTLHLDVGTGGIPVYMPAGGLSGLPYDTLYGRPVLPIEQCATLGTVGDIILADFTNGYILAEKGGVKTDVSIHVAFLNDESIFRFVIRIDGQPVRSTPLIPYKGAANTQSHFIALETRA